VIEELKILRYKYNKKVIDFMDDAFTFNKKRVIQICKLIKNEKIDISWNCTTRVDLFDREIAFWLKKAGCRGVFFGFESGVQQTLDYLVKGFTVEDSEKAVKIAHEAGLGVLGNYIIGVPCETKEMINQTIKFSKKLNLKYANFSLLRPFPGTKFYEMSKKNGLIKTQDWSKYTWNNNVINIPMISTKELMWLQKKTLLQFYFSFSFLRQLIKMMILYN